MPPKKGKTKAKPKKDEAKPNPLADKELYWAVRNAIAYIVIPNLIPVRPKELLIRNRILFWPHPWVHSSRRCYGIFSH